MENLSCPACRIPLTRVLTERGVIWRCQKCDGRAVGLSLLRATFTAESINPIWLHAVHHEGSVGRPCPACGRAMIDVPLASDTTVNVEVCQLCQMVWFDLGEIKSLTPRAPPPEAKPPLPQKVREAVAIAQVQLAAERARGLDFDGAPPDEFWKQIAGYFGLPVQFDTPEPQHFPVATVLLALAITAASIFAFRDLQRYVNDFGFIPAEAMRHHGLTFLTSFFLHAGIIHLAGNMYFFLVFGKDVEDSLGIFRYLALVLAAAFVGDLAHIAMDPRSTLPCIGASGGIAGVLTFYALAFPQEQIAFNWRFFWWIRLPAWFVLVLWITFQMIGAYEQKHGMTSVSSFAHLGGAVAGFVAWLVWRKQIDAPIATANASL